MFVTMIMKEKVLNLRERVGKHGRDVTGETRIGMM